MMDAEKEKERGFGMERGGVGVLDSKPINIKQFEGRKMFKAIIFFYKNGSAALIIQLSFVFLLYLSIKKDKINYLNGLFL